VKTIYQWISLMLIAVLRVTCTPGLPVTGGCGFFAHHGRGALLSGNDWLQTLRRESKEGHESCALFCILLHFRHQHGVAVQESGTLEGLPLWGTGLHCVKFISQIRSVLADLYGDPGRVPKFA